MTKSKAMKFVLDSGEQFKRKQSIISIPMSLPKTSQSNIQRIIRVQNDFQVIIRLNEPNIESHSVLHFDPIQLNLILISFHSGSFFSNPTLQHQVSATLVSTFPAKSDILTISPDANGRLFSPRDKIRPFCLPLWHSRFQQILQPLLLQVFFLDNFIPQLNAPTYSIHTYFSDRYIYIPIQQEQVSVFPFRDFLPSTSIFTHFYFHSIKTIFLDKKVQGLKTSKNRKNFSLSPFSSYHFYPIMI